jgi:Xaa-Pro aminopeptidase
MGRAMQAADKVGEGAEELTRLLARNRARRTVAEVEDLVRGVVAACVADTDDSWISLVAAKPDKALREHLRHLRRRFEAEVEPLAATGKQVRTRLAALRGELARRKLAGFVIPRADEHQGEFVAKGSERLAWLTGFTGSAGCAIVLAEKAALFVDGRYTLQAREQTDPRLFRPRHMTREPPEAWIEKTLPRGGRLGFDPWLHTARFVKRLRAAVKKVDGSLTAVGRNPLDAVWTNRPPPPLGPVVPYALRFAGMRVARKRKEAASALAAERLDAAVLSAPDAIAWLLNLRGADIPYTPLPLCFAVLHGTGRVELFIERRKLLPETLLHLRREAAVHGLDELEPALDSLGRRRVRVRVDEATCPWRIVARLRRAGAELAPGADPCALPKAMKNRTELRGIRAAHRRDGVALVRFLAGLGAAVEAGITELAAARRLDALRAAGKHFRGLSFSTISATGPNAAIIHYRVCAATDCRLVKGTLYLVDSGAQYLDGTTDVTRTVALGRPRQEMRDRFTRVLKGHIALAAARFPIGTTGTQLDTLARRDLWAAGLDYDHGTGHGVGSFLGVHEGPQRISRLGGDTPLQPGMVLSDEPGYYKGGEYGIRIENLLGVVSLGKPRGGECELLGFETLTLAPIDRALIDPERMNREEIEWLDAYHARVRQRLLPLLDEKTAEWLVGATRPVD